jgi:hypothetical protein
LAGWAISTLLFSQYSRPPREYGNVPYQRPHPHDEDTAMAEMQHGPVARPDAPAIAPPGVGQQGVLDLQRAYYQAEIPRAAALASATLVYGFTPAEAEKLFPLVAPVQPVRSGWARAAAGLGALVGAFGGGLFATQLTRSGAAWARQWEDFALFAGLVGGAIIGALVGPLVRLGMIHVWHSHAEST